MWMSYSVKHPILLPRAHPLTELIVREAHDRVFYNGVKETLTESGESSGFLRGETWQSTSSIAVFCVASLRGCLFKARLHHRSPISEWRTIQHSPTPVWTLLVCWVFEHLTIQPRVRFGYVSLLVFVTTAVHLDAVSDQSTQTFISGSSRKRSTS